MIGMVNKNERRFQVKRFLLETKDGVPVLRFMLTDNLLPMLTPNRFIEMKSVNKPGGGRNSAAKLSVFFNFLHEYEAIEYIHATNRHVQRFLDFLIYGDLNDLKITDPSQNVCFSTLQGYLTVITEFYKGWSKTKKQRRNFIRKKVDAQQSKKTRALRAAHNLPYIFLYRHAWNKTPVFNTTYFVVRTNKLIEQYAIRDERWEIYTVTTHPFRYNGVTDRLRAGFTPAQIAEMTAHHGSMMICASYAHLDLFSETLSEPREYFCKTPEKEQPPYFEEQEKSWWDKAEKFKDYSIIKAHFFRDCGSVPAENAERGALGTDETDSKAGADETANS